MSNPLQKPSWSPYVAGALIGVLSWFAFYTADHPLGITTAFDDTAALMIQSTGFDSDLSFFDHEGRPWINWEWMLVVGVFLGSALSAWLGRSREPSTVPALWRSRFGKSRRKRLVAAFVGGAVMMLGARLAGGCTSGHGISGTLQLAVSSLLFVAVMVGSGVVTAFALFGREAERNA